MPDLVTYQTLTDLSPIRGMRLQWIQIYLVCTLLYWVILVLSEGQHSAVEFICYAWLSDLSDANWFESYPKDETAMNSDLFIMYILHWVILVISEGQHSAVAMPDLVTYQTLTDLSGKMQEWLLQFLFL